MLNSDLFTPEERQILKLKAKISKLEDTIAAFKKYDKQRKEYYNSLSTKVGELESYISELEDTNRLAHLNKIYKQQLAALNKKHYLSKIEDLNTLQVNDLFTIENLKKQVKDKDELIKSLKTTISQLITENMLKVRITKPDMFIIGIAFRQGVFAIALGNWAIEFSI